MFSNCPQIYLILFCLFLECDILMLTLSMVHLSSFVSLNLISKWLKSPINDLNRCFKGDNIQFRLSILQMVCPFSWASCVVHCKVQAWQHGKPTIYQYDQHGKPSGNQYFIILIWYQVVTFIHNWHQCSSWKYVRPVYSPQWCPRSVEAASLTSHSHEPFLGRARVHQEFRRDRCWCIHQQSRPRSH